MPGDLFNNSITNVVTPVLAQNCKIYWGDQEMTFATNFRLSPTRPVNYMRTIGNATAVAIAGLPIGSFSCELILTPDNLPDFQKLPGFDACGSGGTISVVLGGCGNSTLAEGTKLTISGLFVEALDFAGQAEDNRVMFSLQARFIQATLPSATLPSATH